MKPVYLSKPRKKIKTWLNIASIFIIFTFGLIHLAFLTRAAPGVPKILSHQGRLFDSLENPLGGEGADFCFKFSFYNDATPGSPDAKLWPAGEPGVMTVNVKNGVYNVGIGDTSVGGDLLDFNFQDNDAVFLNVEVASKAGDTCAPGDGAESFETLNPRQRLFSSGYAINADTLKGFHASQNPVANQIPVLADGDLILPAGGLFATGTISGAALNVSGAVSIGSLNVAGDVTIGNKLTVSSTIFAKGLIAKETMFNEEFIRERFDRTADTAGGSVNGFGDTFAWGLGELGNCSWSILDDAVNGILRQSTIGGGGVGGGKACLSYLSAALGDRHDILKAINNPILAIKLKPSLVGADNWILAGMMDYDDGKTDLPDNGIYFSSEGGNIWQGVTRVGGTQTNVACSGQTVLTNTFAYLQIVAASSTVLFSVDNNTLDGVNPALCGSASTTTPAIKLTLEIMNQAKAGGSMNLDVDFVRINQDDTKDNGESLELGGAGAGSGADIAEEILAVDSESIESGDLLSLVPGMSLVVGKSTTTYDKNLYGVASTDPGLILGRGLETSVRVALLGRLPVKVNLEGGSIEINDWLTSSFEPGVAMKANYAGMVIGRALEPFPSATNPRIDPRESASTNKILFSIEPREWTGPPEEKFNLQDALREFLQEIQARLIQVIKLVAEEIESLVLRTQKLEVGSSDNPGRVIIYDSATHEPYCLRMENGELKSEAGDCEAALAGVAPGATEKVPVEEESSPPTLPEPSADTVPEPSKQEEAQEPSEKPAKSPAEPPAEQPAP